MKEQLRLHPRTMAFISQQVERLTSAIQQPSPQIIILTIPEGDISPEALEDLVVALRKGGCRIVGEPENDG